MMKLQKPILKPLLLVVTLAALVPVLAHAFPGERHDRCEKMSSRGHDDRRGDGPGEGVRASVLPFLSELNLSETQRDEVFTIMNTQAPALRAKTKILRKAQDDIRLLTRSGQYDEAKARELAESLADATVALTLLRAQDEQRIYALLTPEQRKQLQKIQDKPEFEPIQGRGHVPDKPIRSM